MNYAILRPLLAGPEYGQLSDQAAAEKLNSPTVARYRPITSNELLAWLGQEGRLDRLEAAAANPGLDPRIRTVAKVALKLVDRDNTSLDLGRPDHVAMLQALVKAGIANAAESDALQELATYRVSPAAAAGLPPVDVEHVRSCRSLPNE